MFSATISHLYYAVVCFVYFVEYETKDYFEKTIIIPLGRKCHMPDDVHESVGVIHKDLGLFFNWNEDHTTLKMSSTNFGGKQLKTDINISYPDNLDTKCRGTLGGEKRFQFTARHNCLPASGEFSVGDKTFRFDPKTDYAVLDYGRGVWPRQSSWN